MRFFIRCRGGVKLGGREPGNGDEEIARETNWMIYTVTHSSKTLLAALDTVIWIGN